MALHGQMSSRSLLVVHEQKRGEVDPGDAFSRLLAHFRAPSASGRFGWTLAAGALTAGGAFTLSWERFGNLAVGPYNLKLPVVLFTIVAILGFRSFAQHVLTVFRARTLVSVVVALAILVAGYFSVRAVFVDPLAAGLGQIASLLSGAVLPAFVALGTARSRADLRWLLVWIVRGAYFAGAFGLWQLFAFYTGLPQIVVYTGVGTSGVGGRIAAFNYEPAYFAYFIVLAACAALAVARIEGRPLPWRAIAFFAVVLALANVRALMFLLPLIGILLATDWRRNRGTLARAVAVGVPVALLAAFAPIAVQAAVDATARTAAVSIVASDGAAPQETYTSGQSADGIEHMRHSRTADAPTSRERSKVAAPTVAAPSAVLDPSEQSSNAPRLAIYRATLDVDLQHPLVGVGPGGLRKALGQAADSQGGQVVANNMWLQAAADGGIPLLALELALVVIMTMLWLRNRSSVAQPLAAGLLGIVVVGGMLTSYFFDIKLWVIGAVVVAALFLESEASRSSSRERSILT